MLEGIAFLVALRLVPDNLEPLRHAALGDLALVVHRVLQQPLLAGVLLNELLQLAGRSLLLGL